MDKELFEELLGSIHEMHAIRRGEIAPGRKFTLDPDDPDVAAIRARMKLSQPKFARLMGISVKTVQNWEQKIRRPEGPARVLLLVAAMKPEAILEATKGRVKKATTRLSRPQRAVKRSLAASAPAQLKGKRAR